MAGQYIEAMPPFAAMLTLPSQCALCRGWAPRRLCALCVQRFARAVPRCRQCAIAIPDGMVLCGACLKQPPPYDAAVAAVDYDYPWDGLVQRFKFHAGLDLAGALAQRLIDAVRDHGQPLPQLVLPVPLSPARLRERGYNQAWEIARRVAPALGLSAEARLLLRMKDGPHQLALPPARRATNVRGAFALEPRRRAEVGARDIAIVDDVMTTGATAAEIATVLKRAGARFVQLWVIARTPAPAP
jgi:ComF family protein